MIDRMIAIVPADTGEVRKVSPQFLDDMRMTRGPLAGPPRSDRAGRRRKVVAAVR
jgi:hypothetical protein